MEELLREMLVEMKWQTALLSDIKTVLEGTRSDRSTNRKEGFERGMKEMTANIAASFKGTPLEGLLLNMMPKVGGAHGK